MTTKIKKWLIALLFGSAVLAAPLAMPDNSFEKLDNVQKISDRYEVDFGEGSRVKIGGDGVDFKPHAKLGKWDNEVEINVWLETDKKIKPKQDKGKLKWKDRKKEIHFYTIDDDKFEFEVILNEKPDSNITELKIDSRGLKFYYQPALNIEMAGQDCWTDACTETDCCDSYRPENVIGSYAVYHESKAGDYSKMGLKNYRAGKAFHIYRPKIIDNAGKEVWGKLNITDNLLTVEIPQEFLDNAVYPIRHAAGLTFGSDVHVSYTNYEWVGDRAQGSLFTSPSNVDTIQSISVYAYSAVATYFKGIIVLHSNLNIVNNAVGDSENVSQSVTWYTSDFSVNPTLSPSTEYVLMGVAEGTVQRFYFDTGGTASTIPITSSFLAVKAL